MLGLMLTLVFACVDDPPMPVKGYVALKAEYDAAALAWDTRFERPEMADPNKIGSIERYRDWPAWTYAPKFLAIAETNPAGEDAFDALVWIANLNRQVGTGDRLVFPIHSKAMELLERHYIDDPRMKSATEEVLRSSVSPAWEHLARKMAADAKDHDVRGIATIGMATMLSDRAAIRTGLWFDKPNTPFQKFLATRLDPAYVAYVRACDVKASRAEAISFMQRALDDYGEVTFRKQKIATIAARALNEAKAKDGGR